MEPYRIMVVDDQNISRQLFELYISQSPNYQLAYSISSAKIAHIYLDKYAIDCVIMDIVMNDGSNGLEAAERMKRTHPNTKVLIVTSMPEVSYIKKAKEIGVDGFWYKEHSDVTFLEVLDQVMQGKQVYPSQTPEISIGQGLSTEFTKRELEVLRELTRGGTNQEIADRLGIGIGTVRTHIQHMMDITGYGRTQLAIQARLSGIVIPEES